MPRIAEKLELMTGRTVKVCAKVGIARKVGDKTHVFLPFFKKPSRKQKASTVQCDFDKIINIERT